MKSGINYSTFLMGLLELNGKKLSVPETDKLFTKPFLFLLRQTTKPHSPSSHAAGCGHKTEFWPVECDRKRCILLLGSAHKISLILLVNFPSSGFPWKPLVHDGRTKKQEEAGSPNNSSSESFMSIRNARLGIYMSEK